MELILPNNFVELELEEVMYLEGEGWIADSFAVGGAVAGTIFFALKGAAAGSAAASFIPYIGTVSGAAIGGIAGAIFGFANGTVSGYRLGRLIEQRILGWP
ncbi:MULTISPECIES: hypothetical protein [unclassified Streptococcus]|uniref:hypothetical protein n=1 Tax=unclassified Streptococcus TaxID=2608887 RepID=UPI00359CF22A